VLSQLCEAFANKVDALDPRNEDYLPHLKVAVLKLARDAANHVEGSHGEVSAILELGRLVLAWLSSEAEDREDRSRRYNRQRAVLDLLGLCESIRLFHRAGKRKPAEVTAFRGQVGDALRG
jgi:hypothetical protein